MNRDIFRQVGLVLGSLVLLTFVFSSYTIIRPGNTGVIFNTLTGSLKNVPQGIALKVPFITQVQSYPTALRTYTMVAKNVEGSDKGDDSLDLPTLEGQHIKQDLSVTYNTSEDKAADVFKSFRGVDIEDIENTFIRRTIITVAQNVAGSMSLTEVISSKRDLLQSKIQEHLSVELNKMGFTLDKVNMGASHLPAAIEAQMQQKMAAQQEAQQAEYELQKQSTLAKATVAKAQGEANALVIGAKAQAEQQNLLQKTLTKDILALEYLKKWNGQLSTVTSGSGGFMINLSDVLKGKNNE